jgi:hypothetical protein
LVRSVALAPFSMFSNLALAPGGVSVLVIMTSPAEASASGGAQKFSTGHGADGASTNATALTPQAKRRAWP